MMLMHEDKEDCDGWMAMAMMIMQYRITTMYIQYIQYIQRKVW